MQVADRVGQINPNPQTEPYLQGMGSGCSARACFSETAELIEWFTAGIFKHQYDTVPVASEPDRSGRARWIKLFF
jgi:hypothetical protein